MKTMTCVCVVFAMMAAGGEARAEFGAAGTKAVQGNLAAGASRVSEESPSGEDDPETNVALGVTGAYFVRERVSVGGRIAAAYRSEDSMTQKAFGFGLTGGYAARLGERAFLWPQLGIIYAWAGAEIGSSSASLSGLQAQAYVPVYFEPAEHLLIGFGPAITKDLTRTLKDDDGESHDANKSTEVAAIASLVGWF